MSLISITLVYTSTGQSESLTIDSSTTTVSELVDWSCALFGLGEGTTFSGSSSVLSTINLQLLKDGEILVDVNRATNSILTSSLASIKVVDGDLIVLKVQPTMQALQSHQPQRRHQLNRQINNEVTSGSVNGGGVLDFSSLLASAGITPSVEGEGLQVSRNSVPSTSSQRVTSTVPDSIRVRQKPTGEISTKQNQPQPEPVYYPEMSLDIAINENPHPFAMATLLLTKEHLLKELNYHNPQLASKFTNVKDTEQAANIWREEMVKGGIQSAVRTVERYHKEHTMKRRLEENPADMEAIEYFQKSESEKLINEQYREMMEEYPEALGQVLMLYIPVKINDTPIQAFCDTGAQSTIMSKRTAILCKIDHLIDVRFAGTAVGVGTGVILGRIHIVQIQINNQYYFPCSVTVMDDPPPGSAAKEMPFLLGLDMMKRHLCIVDLRAGVLKFYISHSQQYMEAKFLHEKDLREDQGGTIGFDPSKVDSDGNTDDMK